MTTASIDEARARLDKLREARASTRGELEDLDTERRELLRFCIDNGVSQAELARWEGVTDWAISQAVKKA